MPYGFSGQAATNYLKDVEEPLTEAGRVHIKDPFQGCHSSVVPQPSLPYRSNITAPHTADEGSGHTTGFGTCSNIVVSEDIYEGLAKQIQGIDAEIIHVLNQIERQIIEMCTSDFVLPKTTQSVQDIKASVAFALPEFNRLGDNVRSNASYFTGDITAIL